jgi:hypothetical protein
MGEKFILEHVCLGMDSLYNETTRGSFILDPAFRWKTHSRARLPGGSFSLEPDFRGQVSLWGKSGSVTPVLRMRPYRQRSRVEVGVPHNTTLTAMNALA